MIKLIFSARGIAPGAMTSSWIVLLFLDIPSSGLNNWGMAAAQFVHLLSGWSLGNLTFSLENYFLVQHSEILWPLN